MADSQSQSAANGPPYAIPSALLGGRPTVSVDVPISAVFLVLFLVLAVVHMTIFQLNRKISHKFVFSGLLFGLSMARSTAMVMRIVWANYPTNTRIALAANILSQAGVILLFIANLFFTQRMVRAYLPAVGWHNLSRFVFRGLVASVVATLVMIIVTVIHSSYSLDPVVQDKDRKVQLVAGTLFAILAFIPIPVVLSAVLVSRSRRSGNKTAPSSVADDSSLPSTVDDKKQQVSSSNPGRPEKFGTGRMRTKVRLLIFTSTILTLGAAFRVATSFMARPANDPAWYHSRACYYCFNFVIEVIVSALYAAVRFDRRFHVPDGSKMAGDYSRKPNSATTVSTGGSGDVEAGVAAATANADEALESPGVHGVGPRFSRYVNSEEEVFGMDGDETAKESLRGEK